MEADCWESLELVGGRKAEVGVGGGTGGQEGRKGRRDGWRVSVMSLLLSISSPPPRREEIL